MHKKPVSLVVNRSRLDLVAADHQMIIDEAIDNSDVAGDQIPYRRRDSLTGAGNRHGFLYDLDAELSEIKDSESLALVSLDVDGFGVLNKKFGQLGGDQIIVMIANRIQLVFGKKNLFRVGADEFVLFFKADKLTIYEDVKLLVSSILLAMLDDFIIRDNELYIYFSLGVAFCPEHGICRDDLIKNANTARLNAKKYLGNKVEYYNPNTDIDFTQSSGLDDDLVKALKNKEFALYYQPKICLLTRKILGAEALIRWHNPEKGVIYPDYFIPRSEETGFIVHLGSWVVGQALSDMKMLVELGFDCHIAINISLRQFVGGSLSNLIESLVGFYEVDVSKIEIEITETTILESEESVVPCILLLSDLGATFSLDDFGTGYASFATLQKLPVSTLKIDRGFVSGIGKSPNDEQIIISIISLAKKLNKKIVAEGIETEEQLRFLVDHGCTVGQGYLFSRPILLNEFVKYCTENKLSNCKR